MADKRECYAGDVTSDAIDKVVVLAETSGVLQSVYHFQGLTNPVTEFRFWGGRSVTVDHTVLVEVLP